MKYKIKIHVVILGFILLAGFILRLYRFDGPVADWHSWRQADTSSVSRNYAKDGIDLLHPRMDNISNVQSKLENPQGYFFVEFPLYNAAQAGLYSIFGILTIEEWGRLISIISSTLSSLFLYLIVSRHSNRTIGLFAASFYALTPFNIYYGRTILADTSTVMSTLGAIYFFDLWIERRSWVLYFLALIFTTLAFLLKPHALFFVLPMVYLAFYKFGWKTFLQWKLWLLMILSLTPLIEWRIWMMQFPEGIPDNLWLFNSNHIRFRPAFFRWILYERLTVLISGYVGVVFGLIGFMTLRKLKEWMFFLSFVISSVLYVCVIATGNVQHDYYQILVMPSIAIMFAIGSYFLAQWKFKTIPVGKIVLVLCLASSFYFAWDKVKDYFNINNPSIVIAGKAIDKLIPKDAKIIANYEGDSSFLYQTKRKGWANFERPIPDMIPLGASYMALVNPSVQDMGFSKDYKVVVATPQYVLFDIRSK